jgi:SpoVK/Ycf46/Vps4 family AAA+-type ATPase
VRPSIFCNYDFQILVDLPDLESRREMFGQLLPSCSSRGLDTILVDGLDYDELASITEGTKLLGLRQTPM